MQVINNLKPSINHFTKVNKDDTARIKMIERK
jgi:hypothetical protein